MASRRVQVAEIIRERAQRWNSIDRGRVGGVLALLSDDDWRREHQVDRALSEADVEELFEANVVFVDGRAILASELVIEEGLLWDVTHCGVTLTFTKGDLFEEGDRIMFEGDDEIDIFIFDIGIHEDT